MPTDLPQLEYFADFNDRTRRLRQISRYDLYDTFFYRSNVYTHCKRVAWMVIDSAPVISEVGQEFILDRAITKTLLHDDRELFIGDVQAGDKAIMTDEQRIALREQERRALRELASHFPQMVGPYEYEQLLEMIDSSQTFEDQVIKYLDKVDAYCEACHELYAGNRAVTTRVHRANGLAPVPFEYYLEVVNRHPEYYSMLEPLFRCGEGYFRPLELINYSELVQHGEPHTPESFRRPTGDYHYDLWKRTILRHASPHELHQLLTQREFPKQ